MAVSLATRHFGFFAGWDFGFDEPAVKIGIGDAKPSHAGMLSYRFVLCVSIQWPPPLYHYQRPGLRFCAGHDVVDSSAWTGLPRDTPIKSRIAWEHWRPSIWWSRA
jgi:hypothetical protein